MSGRLNDLLTRYADEVRVIYGDSLSRVILYGSYARGDFTEDSDIDIMILVEQRDKDFCESRKKISDITYDFNMDNDLQIMPTVTEKDQFEYWLPVYPFYQNIDREGLTLYGSGREQPQP